VGASVASVALGSASGQSLTEKLDRTQSKLNRVSSKEGVLTTRISRESRALDRLEVQVADLRNREAAVATRLRRKQAELRQAQRRLEILRDHLRRSIAALEDRLVAIYKAGEPDFITVVLNANGYDDLVERADYLHALQDQDSAIVERVRELRNQVQETVDTVKAARDEIARHRQELQSTREALQTRTAALASARKRQQSTLAEVRSQRHDLEGDLSKLSQQVAERLGSGAPLPAGPIRPGQAGFIWPVNGPVVSGFGPRWGSVHEGIDIAVPTGTPIRAAKSGNIVLAAYTGGYGNYTCIDHGGGLSTCYAHQESYVRTSGFVSQGTVIGYTDCTGHCFGPHLHFEVRVNGQAVDPLGYL
jgi:murein DD-endopeptidase MepM/ murein hydrolase activator NlpD